MKSSWIVTAFVLWAGMLCGEVPVNLKETVLSPGKTRQATGEGTAVATDGVRIVTGAVSATFRNHGEGAANVYDAATGQLLITLKNPQYHTDGFGSAVAISGPLVVVGSPQESTGEFKAGSAYVFDLTSPTPGTPVAVLHNPRPQVEAQFGDVVSISGRTVVVGAPQHDESTTNPSSGIAYVYDLAGEKPEQPRFVLENPSPGFAAFFGYNVSVSGSQVAVSAPYNDRGTSRTGSVYLYDLESAAPTTPSRVLKNPEAVESAAFGYSVALSGGRLAVGVLYDELWVPRSGAVYVYDLAGAAPEIPLFAAEGAKDGSEKLFAASVAISETRMVAGNPTGPARTVYDLTAPSSTPIATIARPSGNAGNLFGVSAAVFGNQVVIGAPAYDRGSAFIYDAVPSDAPLAPKMILNGGLPSLDDNFGSAVAMTDRYMVVGAPKENAELESSGAAYIISLENSGKERRTITLANPTPSVRDNFGFAVAISRDRVVIGCPYDDAGASSAGVVYVYDIESETPGMPVLTLYNPRPNTGDTFGYSVAVDGPYVVVGTPNEDAAFKDDGVAYVYDLRSTTPAAPIAILQSSSAAAGDNFGTSLAISGTRVVAGVICADHGATNSGAVYVFELESSDPAKPILEIANPDPAEGDNFGGVVTIDGDFIAASALYDDTDLENAGAVYVFDLSSQTVANPWAVFFNPSPDHVVGFGSAIALSQGKLLVGTPRFKADLVTPGRAYLYEIAKSGSGALLAAIDNPTPDHSDMFGVAVAIKGATFAVGSSFDDTPTIDRGVVHLFEAQDVATDAPHLIRPRANTLTQRILDLSFTLFEPAANGTVKVNLRSANREWSVTLGSAYELAARHELQLNLADLAATPGVVAASGGAVPDGIYDVSVVYQDIHGHVPASGSAKNVIVDNMAPSVVAVELSSNGANAAWARAGTILNLYMEASEATKAPTIVLGGVTVDATGGPMIWKASLPVTRDIPEGNIGLSVTLEDLAGNRAQPVTATSNGSVVLVDHTPPSVQAPPVVRVLASSLEGANVNFEVSATDNLDPTVSLDVSPPSGTAFPLGITTVTAQAEDAAGHTTELQFDVVVRLESAVKTVIFGSGEAVPGAGQPLSGVPAGASWSSFEPPSLLGVTRGEAITGFGARITTPVGSVYGVFSGLSGSPVARLLTGDAATDATGAPLAGATFKSFRDPVFASFEHFAVIARLKGASVSQFTSDGVWAGDETGVFQVARRGSPAPGIDGGYFASFSSVLMPAPNRVYVVASLKGRGIVRTSDSSLWHWSKETGLQLVQRDGASSPTQVINGKVKSFLALQGVNGSPGHGRYDDQLVTGVLTGSDRTQTVVTFDGAETVGTDLRTGLELLPGVELRSLGFPSLPSNGDGMSLRAVLAATQVKNQSLEQAILRDGVIVARKGLPAPGVPEAIFEDFADPVTELAESGIRADAFVARVSGPNIGKRNDEGVWIVKGDDAQAQMLAREGAEAEGCNGAFYKKFISVSLMRGRGVLFTATLDGGSSRAKVGKDTGLWGTDLEGNLRLLLRVGEEINGRSVRRFEVLSFVAGSPAQQRSWNRAALDHVVVRSFFTDGSQAIMTIVLP